jgi:hypothetical protein
MSLAPEDVQVRCPILCRLGRGRVEVVSFFVLVIFDSAGPSAHLVETLSVDQNYPPCSQIARRPARERGNQRAGSAGSGAQVDIDRSTFPL